MQTKWISSIAGLIMAFSASRVFADHTETIIGAGIGGATGAVIGKRMGGGNDAVIWSAIGGATGAAVGRSLGDPHVQRTVVVHERVRYEDGDDYVIVRRPVQMQHIYYEEEPRYYKHKYKNKHHRHHEQEEDDDD